MDFRNWLNISEAIPSDDVLTLPSDTIDLKSDPFDKVGRRRIPSDEEKDGYSYTNIGHKSYWYEPDEIQDVLWVFLHDAVLTRKVPRHGYGHSDWEEIRDAMDRDEIEAQGRIDLKTKKGSVYWYNESNPIRNKVLDQLFEKYPSIKFYEFSPGSGKGKPIPKRIN